MQLMATYPATPTPSAEQQAQIQAHPELSPITDEPPRTTPHALAAKNIRKLLRATFPSVDFKVRSDSYAGGSSVYIRWTEGDDVPSRETVDTLVSKFSYGDFNGMDDSFNHDRDPNHVAFRAMFGSVKYILPQVNALTPAERAQAQSDQLEAATAPAPSRRAGGPRL